jgi:hypothetical protein
VHDQQLGFEFHQFPDFLESLGRDCFAGTRFACRRPEVRRAGIVCSAGVNSKLSMIWIASAELHRSD